MQEPDTAGRARLVVPPLGAREPVSGPCTASGGTSLTNNDGIRVVVAGARWGESGPPVAYKVHTGGSLAIATVDADRLTPDDPAKAPAW